MDYNRLGNKLDEEVTYWRHIEDKLNRAEEEIACNKGRLRKLGETTTRSSLSATKRRVDSPPLSEQVTAWLSTEKCAAGEPPLAKWAKDDDPLPPVCASYDVEQWLSCKSMELPCLSKKDRKGKQRDNSGLPPKTGDSSHPTADLPARKATNPTW